MMDSDFAYLRKTRKHDRFLILKKTLCAHLLAGAISCIETLVIFNNQIYEHTNRAPTT